MMNINLMLDNKVRFMVGESQKLLTVAREGTSMALVFFDGLCLARENMQTPQAKFALLIVWWIICLHCDQIIRLAPLLLGLVLYLYIEAAQSDITEKINVSDPAVLEKRMKYSLVLVKDSREALQWGYSQYQQLKKHLPQSSTQVLVVSVLLLPLWWCVLSLVSFSFILWLGGTLAILESIVQYRRYRQEFLNGLATSLAKRRSAKLKQRLLQTARSKDGACFGMTPLSEYPKDAQSALEIFYGKLHSITREKAEAASLPFKLQTSTIQIYENQRHARVYGWQPPIQANDPGAWTLTDGSRVLPKSLFELPEPTIQPVAKGTEAQALLYWGWEDDEWSTVYSSTTDDMGWSYGTTNWSDFSSRPSLLFNVVGGALTRRRQWQRRAILYRVVFV